MVPRKLYFLWWGQIFWNKSESKPRRNSPQMGCDGLKLIGVSRGRVGCRSFRRIRPTYQRQQPGAPERQPFSRSQWDEYSEKKKKKVELRPKDKVNLMPNKTDPLQYCIQHWHIILLGFDCVREEDVSLIWNQLVDGDTFDWHYHVRFTQVLLHSCSGGNVLLQEWMGKLPRGTFPPVQILIAPGWEKLVC